MVTGTKPTYLPLPLTDDVEVSYTIGLTTYPLIVSLYTANRFDPLAEWECERITLDVPGVSASSLPNLYNLFEAIHLPPADPTRPSWGFRRTAADEIVERATEKARRK